MPVIYYSFSNAQLSSWLTAFTLDRLIYLSDLSLTRFLCRARKLVKLKTRSSAIDEIAEYCGNSS